MYMCKFCWVHWKFILYICKIVALEYHNLIVVMLHCIYNIVTKQNLERDNIYIFCVGFVTVIPSSCDLAMLLHNLELLMSNY